jgi:hypothetical protein
MPRLTDRQKTELQNAQVEFFRIKEKLDLIIELIADAHGVTVPFVVDPATLEVTAAPLDNSEGSL